MASFNAATASVGPAGRTINVGAEADEGNVGAEVTKRIVVGAAVAPYNNVGAAVVKNNVDTLQRDEHLRHEAASAVGAAV